MGEPARYLRHPWTHKSEFQKTKEWHRVDVDECTVYGEKSLCHDSDDELSENRRAAKRRRIERLAEDYLRGEPLLFPSVRPCFQTVQTTITWHKRSSTHPGYKANEPDLRECDITHQSSEAWSEVEDDDEILDRLLRSSRSRTGIRAGAISGSEHVEVQPVEECSAQARCKPRRRLRTADISSGPSEAALQKAAALRNRRNVAAMSHMSTIAEASGMVTTPASDPADCINITQSERMLRSQREKSEWLSRQKPRSSFGDDNPHPSRDAVSSPCLAPSSLRTPRSAQSGMAFSPAPEAGSPSASTRTNKLRSTGSQHAATIDHDIAENTEAAASSNRDPKTHEAKPPTAESVAEGAELAICEHFGARPAAHHAPDYNVAAPSRATRPTTLPIHPRPAYLQAPSTQNGSTPLMYRKKTSKLDASETALSNATSTTTRRSTRRRMAFSSSEDVPPSEAPQERQHIASHPPVLDMSFQPDYSFAPNLNMALVEEHTEKLSPREPKSDGHVDSTKKALRRSLRGNGARLTSCDSEPPTAIEVQPPAQSEPGKIASAESQAGLNAYNASRASDPERRQTWLGTQAMVARAERDLWMSPEKQQGAVWPINEQTPESRLGSATKQTPASQERGPLKQLSQEPAPSTQAILEGFHGFSTIKKPRSATMLKHAMEPSPVATEKNHQPESNSLIAPRRNAARSTRASRDITDRTGSSLRFSMTSLSSPAATGRIEQDSQASVQCGDTNTRLDPQEDFRMSHSSLDGRHRQRSSLRSSARQHVSPEQRIQPMPSEPEDEPTWASEDLQSLSLFQPAQRRESPVGLLKETSNMSQTIDELTRDLLVSRDMEGVLSQ